MSHPTHIQYAAGTLPYTLTHTLPGLGWRAIARAVQEEIERRKAIAINCKGTRLEERETIATLQKFLQDLESNPAFVPHNLITEHNLGVLTLHPHHSHVRNVAQLRLLWNENCPFILNVNQGSREVRRSDYAGQIEVRVKFRSPPQTVNLKS